MASLHKYKGSYDTLDNPSGRICVPNKTEDENLNVSNMIARINKQ